MCLRAGPWGFHFTLPAFFISSSEKWHPQQDYLLNHHHHGDEADEDEIDVTPHTSLFVLNWEDTETSSPLSSQLRKNKSVVFDINGWYDAQMPDEFR